MPRKRRCAALRHVARQILSQGPLVPLFRMWTNLTAPTADRQSPVQSKLILPEIPRNITNSPPLAVSVVHDNTSIPDRPTAPARCCPHHVAAGQPVEGDASSPIHDDRSSTPGRHPRDRSRCRPRRRIPPGTIVRGNGRRRQQTEDTGGMADETATTDVRIERDSMGEMRVPAGALYGATTARAVENFPISGLVFSRSFLRALGLIKGAAAQVNADLGLLPQDKADLIARAA